MFTGIIEERGKIRRITRARTNRIEIASTLAVKAGDSVAVQGACLTIVAAGRGGFSVEAMTRTRDRTTIAALKNGDAVNLERALSFNGRLGGHIMLGHVDEVGRVKRIVANDYYLECSAPNARYLIARGSIGVDGASLTISAIAGRIFTVSLVPYTQQNTTLGRLRVNSCVNIEFDYLVKILLGSPASQVY